MLFYDIPELSALIVTNNPYSVHLNLIEQGIRIGERALTPDLYWEAINSVEVDSQFEYEQLIFDTLYVAVDSDAPFASELIAASGGMNLGFAIEQAFDSEPYEADTFDYIADYLSEWTIVEWVFFLFFLLGVWTTLQKLFGR